MSFSFSGRHMAIGAALTHHAAELCEKLAQKYEDELADVSIVMTKDSFLFVTDLSIKLSKMETFYAKAESKEPYASFEAALQKISTQIKKFRDKCAQKACAKPDMVVPIEDKDEINTPAIISEIIDELPTLSVSEAVTELNKKEHEIIMFYNKVTKLINVVYFKKDGNIGWVDYR